MRRARTIVQTGLLLTLLAGCTARNREEPAAIERPPGSASTQLQDSSGRTVAAASAAEAGDALRVRVEAAGLGVGVYGVHLHSAGRCDPPSFESAGPHWNPANREHGRDNPRGQHLGDLPNLLVGTDGRGSLEFTIPGADLAGGNRRLLDADGAAIVLHARPDDYRTDPSGNSGARIACGILR
jgi:superoxide dismutase, Cu-Zn family